MDADIDFFIAGPGENDLGPDYELVKNLYADGYTYGALAVKPNGDVFFIPFIRPHAAPAGRWGNPIFLANHPIVSWHETRQQQEQDG